jgi:hypothetical protein
MPVPPEPVEFSVEDAILNTWVEESGDYLRLDPADPPPEPAEETAS